MSSLWKDNEGTAMILFQCNTCGIQQEGSHICTDEEDGDVHVHLPEDWWYSDMGCDGKAIYCSKECLTRAESGLQYLQ